jgi:predicted MFS family arabinose efflux permease
MHGRDRRIVAATFAAQGVAIGSTIGAFSLFVRPIADSFGASTLQVSAGISLLTLTLAASGVPVGTWLDRRAPRRVMVTGTAILAGGLLLASQAQSLGQLAVLCVFTGTGIPMLGPLTTAAVVGKAVTVGRGRALGIANMGLPLGGLGFALAGAFLLEAWGWRGTLAAFSVAVVVIALPLVWCWIPSELDANDGAARGGGASPALARSSVFWLAALPLGIGMGVNAGWLAHLAPYLADVGASTRHAGALLAASQGLAVIGTFGFGALADRRSAIAILAALFSFQIGGFLLLRTHPTLLVVSAIVVSVGVLAGGIMPVCVHLLAERFGAASLGRAVGLANLCLLPFGAGLPMVAGGLRDAQGSYDAVLLVCAALMLAGVALLAVLQRVGRPLSA